MTKQANRNPIKEQEEEQDKKKLTEKKALKKVIFFKYFFSFLSFPEKKTTTTGEWKKRRRERFKLRLHNRTRGGMYTSAARAQFKHNIFWTTRIHFFNSFYRFVGGSGTGGRVKRCYYLKNYYCYCNFNMPYRPFFSDYYF